MFLGDVFYFFFFFHLLVLNVCPRDFTVGRFWLALIWLAHIIYMYLLKVFYMEQLFFMKEIRSDMVSSHNLHVSTESVLYGTTFFHGRDSYSFIWTHCRYYNVSFGIYSTFQFFSWWDIGEGFWNLEMIVRRATIDIHSTLYPVRRLP